MEITYENCNIRNMISVAGIKIDIMNKQNRIFVLGFFWALLGGFVAAIRVHDMINGTWEHLWYEYIFLAAGTITGLNGLRMLYSVTEGGEEDEA